MSLEGLGALIQLESTRLEGARQTSQNFQQANSAVQQAGAQTAQAKTGIWRDKIEATYSKEVQEATVRKLESRLARERKAEAMAKTIAMGVTAISALSNAWDSVSDLVKQTQKLGDIPDYLKTPKIDPNGQPPATTVMTTTNPDNTGNVVWAIGANSNGTESVQCMAQGNDGSMKDAKSAVIGSYDIRSILGNDQAYKDLAAKNNGNVTFAMLAKENPALAMKVMQDKQHAIGRSESAEFVDVLKAKMPPGVVQMEHTTPVPITPQTTDTDSLARIQSLVKSSPTQEKFAEELAKIKDTVAKDSNGNPTTIGKLVKPTDFDGLKAGFANAESLARVKEATSGGASNDPTPNTDNDKPKNYSMVAVPQSDGGLSVTMWNKDKNESTTINLGKDDPDIAAFKGMGKSKGANDNELLNKFMSKPAVGTPVKGNTEAAKDFQTKVASANTFEAARDSLKGTRMLDENYDSPLGKVGSVLGDVGKAGMNFVVNTAKDAAPYFQAYLAQKSRADAVEEELIEARQKLAAENKKLKNIQMQIDLFNGRGS